MKIFEKSTILPDQSIRHAVKVINEGKLQIALVVDKNKVLKGTITDGDVRRAILLGCSLDENCYKIPRCKDIPVKRYFLPLIGVFALAALPEFRDFV